MDKLFLYFLDRHDVYLKEDELDEVMDICLEIAATSLTSMGDETILEQAYFAVKDND